MNKSASDKPGWPIIAMFTDATAKQAAKEGNPEAGKELGRVLERERRLESFERDKLKAVEQLPDLPDTECEFLWDFVEDEQDHFQEIRLGDRLIWREWAFWENGARFGEIEDLLKQKYGKRFKSLSPTPRSEMWLWGDKCG